MPSLNRACPLCGSKAASCLRELPAEVFCAANPSYRPNFAEILEIEPETPYPLVRCDACGFVFAGWLPPRDFLRRVYEELVDESRLTAERLAYRQRDLELAVTILSHASQLERRPLQLLDFGCGYGALIRCLETHELRCLGYDPSASRRERAAVSASEVVSDLDAVAERGPFDVLIATEVLEHLEDPRAALRFLRGQARAQALLVVTVPDLCELISGPSFDERLRSGTLPKSINPWEHLNYFSPAHLRRLLDEEGWQVVRDLAPRRRRRRMHRLLPISRVSERPSTRLLLRAS